MAWNDESIADLILQRNKLIETTIRSIEILEWISDCSEDKIASDVAKGQAQSSIIKLSEVGIERYGTAGKTMNENYGWFRIESAREFKVVVPAWIMLRDGDALLFKHGIGE